MLSPTAEIKNWLGCFLLTLVPGVAVDGSLRASIKLRRTVKFSSIWTKADTGRTRTKSVSWGLPCIVQVYSHFRVFLLLEEFRHQHFLSEHWKNILPNWGILEIFESHWGNVFLPVMYGVRYRMFWYRHPIQLSIIQNLQWLHKTCHPHHDGFQCFWVWYLYESLIWILMRIWNQRLN